MKLNQLILSLFVNLAIVLSISINVNANEKSSAEIKPICVSEECFGENDSDIIVFDPTYSKIKAKDIYSNRQIFDALSQSAFGAKVNVHYTVQIAAIDIHILNRQLLL